jgi:hypothetical protein
MAKDSDGKDIKVGDNIGFKSDYEQAGKVVKILGDRIQIFNPNGFGGEYLRYDNYAWEDASRCWLE